MPHYPRPAPGAAPRVRQDFPRGRRAFTTCSVWVARFHYGRIAVDCFVDRMLMQCEGCKNLRTEIARNGLLSRGPTAGFRRSFPGNAKAPRHRFPGSGGRGSCNQRADPGNTASGVNAPGLRSLKRSFGPVAGSPESGCRRRGRNRVVPSSPAGPATCEVAAVRSQRSGAFGRRVAAEIAEAGRDTQVARYRRSARRRGYRGNPTAGGQRGRSRRSLRSSVAPAICQGACAT